jgi:hypothetical protein
MSMGFCLGLLVLYKTWRPDGHRSSECVMTTGMLSGLYWLTGISAILYPGTDGADPEFGGGFPQAGLFGGLLGASIVAWWLENRRVVASKSKTG